MFFKLPVSKTAVKIGPFALTLLCLAIYFKMNVEVTYIFIFLWKKKQTHFHLLLERNSRDSAKCIVSVSRLYQRSMYYFVNDVGGIKDCSALVSSEK